MADHTQRKKDITKFRDLRAEYVSKGFEALHMEIRDYLMPKGATFDSDEQNNDGTRKDSKIYNSVPILAHRTTISGLFAGVASPAEKWFKYIINDKKLREVGVVKEYFDTITDIVLTILSNSNFYTSLGVVYAQQSGFGTAALQIEEDFDKVLRFTPLIIGQYAIDTDSNGIVNYLGREYSMRAYNVIEMFGEDKVSDKVKAMVAGDKTGSEWVKIIHIQEPNVNRDTTKLDSKNLPYRSVYYESNGNIHEPALRESGYSSKPFVAPRWAVMGDNTWGNGLGEDVLGDIKVLQALAKDFMVAVAKKIHPPLAVAGTAGNISVNASSNGITWVDGFTQSQGPQVSPLYQVNIEIDVLLLAITQHEDRIKTGLLADLFFRLSTTDKKPQTAFEIAEIKSEVLRLLGPVVERQYPDLFSNVLERAYNIAADRGLIPEPPQEIIDADFKAEIISSIAMAQRSSTLMPMEQFVGMALNYSQVFPEVIDKVNIDQVMDEAALALGVPAGTINSDEIVEESRRIKAEFARQQQEAEQAAQAVDSAQKLGNTDMTKDSALSAITGA